MRIFRTRFVSPQGEKNLTTYKYSGSDASLLYKHFFSPCAQFLVDHIFPTWLAPNVITLTGFACTLIPHLIVLFAYPAADGGSSEPIPWWLCIIAAIGQLAYMILDNADGKQARKTGSSSPLGLLFDHGCDAMNTFVSGLTLFRTLQFENTTGIVYAYIIAMTTFFLATWEEYYVEALNLPIVNGANEGIFFLIILYIITAIFGGGMWTTQAGAIQVNVIVLIVFAAMAVVTILTNIINVYRYDRTKFLNALYNLLMITYLDATMIIVTYLSYTDVIKSSSRLLIYFIGFSFAKLVGHLQVSHCAHEKFQQLRKTIIFSCAVLNVHTIVGYLTKHPLFNESDFLLGCFIYAVIIYAHFVISICWQFCRVLRIHIFKLGKRDDNGTLVVLMHDA